MSSTDSNSWHGVRFIRTLTKIHQAEEEEEEEDKGSVIVDLLQT
jgi:hypothetical protein